MNAHARLLATTDGLYRLNDETGHYEPYKAQEEHYPYPVLIIIGLCGLAWSAIAAGYWLVG